MTNDTENSAAAINGKRAADHDVGAINDKRTKVIDDNDVDANETTMITGDIHSVIITTISSIKGKEPKPAITTPLFDTVGGCLKWLSSSTEFANHLYGTRIDVGSVKCLINHKNEFWPELMAVLDECKGEVQIASGVAITDDQWWEDPALTAHTIAITNGKVVERIFKDKTTIKSFQRTLRKFTGCPDSEDSAYDFMQSIRWPTKTFLTESAGPNDKGVTFINWASS
jgi:hypothetical protein